MKGALTARAESRALQIDDLVDLFRRGKLRIPNFQRLLCWEAENVLSLFDSISKGYPAGTLLLWERAAEAERIQLGPASVDGKHDPTALFVVDGQQRITTIAASLCHDLWVRSDSRFDVLFNLDTAAFELNRPDDSAALQDSDIHARLPMSVVADTVRLLDWQAELPNDSNRRRRIVAANRIAKSVREYRFPVVVLHGDDEAAIREVFRRTNESGRPLGMADVFHALMWRGRDHWLGNLDVRKAVQNVRLDSRKDWVLDPYRWPELDWVERNADHPIVEKRLSDVGVRASLPISVPSTFSGRRPAVMLDLLDRVAYQSLVDSFSLRLHEGLPAWVFGYRLPQSDRLRKSGHYASNEGQWLTYTRIARSAALKKGRFFLTLDVASFFASVRPALIENVITDAAGASGGDYRGASRLCDMIRGWSRQLSRSGLPQRCLASSVIANRILAPLDDILVAWRKGKKTRGCLRWMDDFVAWSTEHGELFGLMEQLRGALETIGLRVNESKTRVEPVGRLDDRFGARDIAAADYDMTRGNTDKLAELTAKVRERPEEVSASQLKFVLSRLGTEESPLAIDDWKEVFLRMPHGADQVAWLLRRTGQYSAMRTWFESYLDSPWSSCSWSRSKLIQMFPPGSVPPTIIRRWRNSLASGDLEPIELPFVARHLARTPGSAALLQHAAREAKDPISQRWLVLASLEAGASLKWSIEELERSDENELTRHVLLTHGKDWFLTRAEEHALE